MKARAEELRAEKGGKKKSDVLASLQHAGKFGVRYSTLGFQDNAELDDGDMWATSFAIPTLTDDVRTRVAELVRTAVGQK